MLVLLHNAVKVESVPLNSRLFSVIVNRHGRCMPRGFGDRGYGRHMSDAGDFEFERKFFLREMPAVAASDPTPLLIAQAYLFAADGYAVLPAVDESALAGADALAVVADAGRAIPDWSGGTRLAQSLDVFLRRWGRPLVRQGFCYVQRQRLGPAGEVAVPRLVVAIRARMQAHRCGPG